MTDVRTIRLAGELAEQFGHTHRLAVSSVGEAVVAIEANRPGFRAALRDLLDRGWMFRVSVAGRDIADGEVQLVSRGDILITPVVVGADGAVQAVVGVALIAAGFMSFGVTSAIGMAMIAGGAGMVLGGILGMMVKVPTVAATDGSKGGKSSYVFGGSQTTSEQGVPVPVLCGEVRTSGVVISAGISVEDM